jgi:2,3,4,5-tetrahydropyridine-2,6-dicarboxylate N-succinyltransferase
MNAVDAWADAPCDAPLTALRARVEELAANPQRTPDALALLAEVRGALERGEIRVAEPSGGTWVVHRWVKETLLLHMKLGQAATQSKPFAGVELDTLPWRMGPVPGCRIPAGSLIRRGAYLASGVTCMPPSVVQMGAWIGEGSSIDSHALIGAGAQIGQRVIVGCGAVVGGVVLPLDAQPTIVEDDVILGGGCGVYDGVQIGCASILVAGTVISPLFGVFDAENQIWLRSEEDRPLRIPSFSVVAMGARSMPGGTADTLVHVPMILGRRMDSDERSMEAAQNIESLHPGGKRCRSSTRTH